MYTRSTPLTQLTAFLTLALLSSAPAYTTVLSGGTSQVVTNGWTANGSPIQIGAGSDANQLLVTQFGDITAAGNIETGGDGSFNSFVIDSGGMVTGVSGYVGRGSNAVDNAVQVSGNGSAWSSQSFLRVGHYGSGNRLEVTDGGMVINGSVAVIGSDTDATANRVLVSGPGSRWQSGGPITVGYAGSGNRLDVAQGGRVDSAGLDIGSLETGHGNEVLVTGNGSMLDSSGFTAVGRRGSDNRLTIIDGGMFEAPVLAIGAYGSAENNRVTVSGMDSRLTIDGALMLGGYFEPGGAGNTLAVLHTGQVFSGQLENRNEAQILLQGGGRIATGSYYQDAESSLQVLVETDEGGQPLAGMLEVSGTAEFEEGATIHLLSNMGSLEFNRYYTNTVVASDKLIIGDRENASTADLDRLNIYSSLLYTTFMEDDQDILVQFSRRRLAEAAGFEEGSQMERIADLIDHRGLSGSERATRQFLILSAMEQPEMYAQMQQLYEYSSPSYRHAEAVKGGMETVLDRGDAVRGAGEKPAGAEGPFAQERGPMMWLNVYGNYGSMDATGGYSEYDHDIKGAVLGYDQVFGNWLLGIAGGLGDSRIDQTDGDRSESDTSYVVLNTTYSPDDWFVDLALALGTSSIDWKSGTAFDTSARFDADHVETYIGGGMVKELAGGIRLLPELALQTGFYQQDSYTENSSVEPRHVKKYERWSVRSILGTSLEGARTDKKLQLIPRGRLYWIHEFDADDDAIDFTLGTGSDVFKMWTPGLDDDLLKVGTGLSLFNINGFEMTFDVDGFIGSSYTSMLVSGRVAYEF